MVRMIYELYTVRGLSIGAITRLLNEQGVATLQGKFPVGSASTIWAMLREPCLQRDSLLQQNEIVEAPAHHTPDPFARRNRVTISAHHERPRARVDRDPGATHHN